MNPIIAPLFLKQKARRLKKEKNISQHQALDQAAKLFGYSNHKNYLNILKANHKPATPIKKIS